MAVDFSKVKNMLSLFTERYKGKTTGRGQEIRIDEQPDGSIMLWYLLWGEYQGVDDHHHMGIARVQAEGNQYAVDLYEGNCQQPADTRIGLDLDSALAVVDAEIANE